MNIGTGGGSVATNTAFGASALAANQAGGTNNTAIGNAALDANTTGDANTAVGDDALGANTTGSGSVAVGYQAGYTSTTNGVVTAVGYQAAYTNNSNITAMGYQAAKASTGAGNTAIGVQALLNGSTGNYNTALGETALLACTIGSSNTAVGMQALLSSTTASNNIAVGYQALYSSTTAANNTAVGHQAGYSQTTSAAGGFNVFMGAYAGNASTGSGNTFVGGNSTTGYGARFAMTTGSKNTIIGGYSGNQGGLDIRTSSNNIVISDGDGNPKLRCINNGPDWTSGGTWITSNPTPVTAASVASSAGTAAVWDGSGNLYKQSSSMRYKENIAEWAVTDAQLDAFVNLNPKLWDYIGKENGCAGFIAEDIEALGLKNAYNTSPLINYSNEGQPDSNRDFSLIALQHKVIQRLEKSLQEQQALITTLTTRITALEAKVGA
jgi:hypothetical protein